MSHLQRTQKRLKWLGRVSDISEGYNEWAGGKNDLFGFIDIVTVEPGRIIAVQVCGPSERPAHLRKIKAEPRARHWLDAGGAIELWTWRKLCRRKVDGTKSRSKIWVPRVDDITFGRCGPDGDRAWVVSLSPIIDSQTGAVITTGRG